MSVLADHRFRLENAAFIAWNIDDSRCPQVAAMVSLEELPKASLAKLAASVKDAAAIRYGHSMATSIMYSLCSPVFGNRPKLVRKNTKAAAAEAAAKVAAEATKVDAMAL